MTTAVIIVLAAAVIWLITGDARREWVEVQDAEWDAWVEQALAQSETPIYDELVVARFRDELEEWGQ